MAHRKLSLVPQRILNKIKFKSNGCWIWTGATAGRGRPYGLTNLRSRKIYAHRFIYQLLKGPIPKHTELHHLCNETLCVNPKHLTALTHKDHMYLKGKTHCIYGHERIIGKPCKTCDKIAQQRKRDKLRLKGLDSRGNPIKPPSTHCPRGHELVATSKGKKYCRICQREHARKVKQIKPSRYRVL